MKKDVKPGKVNPLVRIFLWWFGSVINDCPDSSTMYFSYRLWLFVARMKTVFATGDAALANRWYPKDALLHLRQSPGLYSSRTLGSDLIHLACAVRCLVANRNCRLRILVPLLLWLLLCGIVCWLVLGIAWPSLFLWSLAIAIVFPLVVSRLLWFGLWLVRMIRALFYPFSANV